MSPVRSWETWTPDAIALFVDAAVADPRRCLAGLIAFRDDCEDSEPFRRLGFWLALDQLELVLRRMIALEDAEA